MHTLANAAREFIAERLDIIEHNDFSDYTPEDLASAQREHDLIEGEIVALTTLLDAARAIAGMKHPSIERLLRRQGFGFEADRVVELVMSIEAVDDKK